MYFQELLAVPERVNLEFFYNGLRETVPEGEFTQEEYLYVASIFAHYSLTSRLCTDSMPAPANLAQVFDHFILKRSTQPDPELLEAGGAQIMLMTGFFRGYMQSRHNLKWFEKQGSDFFAMVSHRSPEGKKRRLFKRLADNFHPWSLTSWNFNRRLSEEPLLIRIKPNGGLQ